VSVALVIEHSKLMHRIIASSVACAAQTYSFTLSNKGYDFPKRVTEYKTCFDSLYKFCPKCFSV